MFLHHFEQLERQTILLSIKLKEIASVFKTQQHSEYLGYCSIQSSRDL
jgi:hypothetical protein